MSSARYFTAAQAPPSADPHKELIASLERLVRNYPPTFLHPGGGFYHGPASIALLFFVLSKHYKDLLIDNIPLLQWSLDYIAVTDSQRNSLHHSSSSRHGISADHSASLALTAALTISPNAVEQPCNSALTPSPDHSKLSNEWLYGHAGTLYLLRLARSSLPPSSTAALSTMITNAADKIIRAILSASPQPWSWHDKVYVGAAHGIIGIITQIVLTDPAYAFAVEKQLDEYILQTQSESGNWPSSLPPGGKHDLVQFCHGAPGVVNSLLSIRDYFPNLRGKIDEAVEKGRKCIRERGLLVKEPCLCHGISGNALALEAESEKEDEGGNDGRFEHFMGYTNGTTIRGMMERGLLRESDHPESLWGGEAGRAWAWAVMDQGLEKRYLGYNDI